MKTGALATRTRDFSYEILRQTKDLPRSGPTSVIAYQLSKSSTSVGANYAEVCRSRSRAEFISKLNIVIQELEETMYWLGALKAVGKDVRWVREATNEANQLMAMLVASARTARRNQPKKTRM